MADEETTSADVASMIAAGPGEKTDDADEKLDAAETPAVEGEAKPAEGTPDKALQKVQQDLAAQSRKIDQLLAKKESGEQLTDKDKQELDRSRQRIDKIRSGLKGKAFEVIDGGVELAEQVVEASEQIGRIDDLESEVSELRERLSSQSEQQSWSSAEKIYAGVDVRTVWKNAVTEARKTLGEDADPGAIHKLASRDFHRAAKGAAERKKKDDPTPTKKRDGEVVGVQESGVPTGGQSPEAQYEALLGGLTKKEKF